MTAKLNPVHGARCTGCVMIYVFLIVCCFIISSFLLFLSFVVLIRT